MYFQRFFISFFLTILSLLFILSSVNSVCINNLNSVKVYSGNYYLGNFSLNNEIFINPNLNTNQIKVEFIFINNEASCFSSNSKFSFKLFQSSQNLDTFSYLENTNNNGDFLTSIIFEPNLGDFQISNNFISQLFLDTNKLTDINFLLDNNKPNINFNLIPQKNIYLNNENVNLDLSLDDLGSGISSILISSQNNLISKSLLFQNNKSLNLNYGLTLTSNDLITIKVTDALGFFKEIQIPILVDSVPPQIIKNSNFNDFDLKYTFDLGKYFLEVENILIEDSSFLDDLKNIKIIGNFSSINLDKNNLIGNCNRDNNLQKFICSFNKFEITTNIPENSQVPISFLLTDDFNNEKVFEFNTEILIDKKPPQILDFYLLNSNNIKNFATLNDENSYIYLRFKDESFNNLNSNPRVFEDFSILTFPENLLRDKKCNFLENSGEVECFWDLKDKLSLFIDANINRANFKIEVIDEFDNLAKSNFDFIIDNKIPKILDLTFSKSSGIESGVLRSFDILDFSIIIEDENLVSTNNDFFINADFSRISKNTNIKNGICHILSGNSYQCDFNSIELRDGYRKDFILFNISDISGNRIFEKKEIEILGISENDIGELFKITDLNKNNLANKNEYLYLLNPINRNRIMTTETDIWFEGVFNKISNSNSQISLVNYDLKGCNFIDPQNPFVIGSAQLYPNSPVYYKNEEDGKFVLKVRLNSVSNPSANDLNDFLMKCSFSIEERDNEKIFPSRDLDFTLKIGFYDLPRGGILKAQAKDILNKIYETKKIGSSFDEIYGIYKQLDDVCRAITTIGTASNTINNIINGVQVITSFYDGASGGTITGPFSAVSENSKNYLLNLVGDDISGYVYKACDFVTCKSGGILGDYSGPNLGNYLGDKICTSNGGEN